MQPDTGRRNILKAIGTIGVTAVVPVFLEGCTKVDIQSVTAHLVSELEYPDTAKDLGGKHIKQTPALQSVTAEQVSGKMLHRLGLTIDSTDLDDLSRILREQVNGDFVSEDIVIVDGWMLSETEAMLCALAALFNPASATR